MTPKLQAQLLVENSFAGPDYQVVRDRLLGWTENPDINAFDTFVATSGFNERGLQHLARIREQLLLLPAATPGT